MPNHSRFSEPESGPRVVAISLSTEEGKLIPLDLHTNDRHVGTMSGTILPSVRVLGVQ